MKLSKSGIFLIVVLVIAIGLGVWVAIMTCDVLAKDPITMPDRGSAAGTPRPVQNADKPKEPDTFVISMVGDCTLASIQTGRDFDSYIDKNGTSWPFSGVVDYLDQDEFTLANLECTFSDEKLKSSSLFYFRGPSSYADILVQGSVECVTLGNNHTDDFGAKGVADTKAALDAVGVPWAAAGESKVITTEHGLKIGIYCPGWTGLSKSNITTGIQKLKEAGADILIFAPHWGTEGSYKVTANQESFAHAAACPAEDGSLQRRLYLLQSRQLQLRRQHRSARRGHGDRTGDCEKRRRQLGRRRLRSHPLPSVEHGQQE